MAQFPAPTAGMVLTHFIVSWEGERSIVALANGWVIISVAGGPTDDKPTVTLVPPSDPDHASSFLNIRVADIDAVYELWSARGAEYSDPADRPWQRAPLLHARP